MRRRELLLGLTAGGAALYGCRPPAPDGAPAPAPKTQSPVLPNWQAVALLNTAKRLGPGVSPAAGAYFWRTPSEVLFLRPAGPRGEFRFSALALSDGRERPFVPPNPRLRGGLRGGRVRIATPAHPEGEVRYLPPPVSLSPDGRWLLGHGGLQWTAFSLEGTEVLHWRQPSPLENPAVWLRDGRHWAELEADAREGRDYLRRVHLHDLRDPRSDRTIETPALEAGSVLGFTPESRLVIRHPSPVLPAEEVRLTEVDLAAEQGMLRPYPIRLPRIAEVLATELSPSGNLLAWMLVERQGGQPAYSIWASRPDGTGMTLIGTHPVPARRASKMADLRPEQSLDLLRWLPSGNALSFVAGGSFYVLSLAG